MEENLATDADLYEHYQFTVDPGQEAMRLDRWLQHKLANASRTKIQAGIEAGAVRVNGRDTKSNYKIRPGDEIKVLMPDPPRDTEVYPENIPLNIVYEDEELLVVNKPAGMVVHPGYNNYNGTLVNALVYHFGQLPQRDANQRPGLVHRIDKDTSGLLVIGKTEYALSHLARQFYEHTSYRKYHALIWGEPAEDEGTIHGYLNRDPKDRRKNKNYALESEGREAITHYKVLEHYYFASLIECVLETGRTHQIRVHLSSRGHPIFSDEMYGGKEILKGSALPKFKQFIANAFELMPRQALHAKELGFVHPRTGEKMFFDSPLPPDFAGVLEKIRKYVASKA